MKLPISILPGLGKRRQRSLVGLPCRMRPALELLEDRTAPATLTFLSGTVEATADDGGFSVTSSVSTPTFDSDLLDFDDPSPGFVQTLASITVPGVYETEFIVQAGSGGEGPASFTAGSTTAVTLRIDPEAGETPGTPVAIDMIYGLYLSVRGSASGSFTGSCTIGSTTTPLFDESPSVTDDTFDVDDFTTVFATIGQTFTLTFAASGNANLSGFGPNWLGEITLYLDVRPGAPAPDIRADAVTLDSALGNVALSYSIAGGPLPARASVELFWAGPGPSTLIGSPIAASTSALNNGTYSLFVTAQNLGRRPAGASYLVLTIDRGDSLAESNEANNFTALELPPAVVNILTHGFNPAAVFQPYDPASSVWTTFRAGWGTLKSNMESLATGTVLENQVASSVTEWDSSTGWGGAVVSILTAQVNPNPLGKVLANLAADIYLATARRLAEFAAEDIVNAAVASSLILVNPSLSTALQRIHLVGHSRGGAVNARVANLLHQQGYVVDQYTALDGYSTDWPNLSSILGDISIVDQVGPLPTRGDGDYQTLATRKVNYLVETGLDFGAMSWLESVINRSLRALDISVLTAELGSWKAPARSGFENHTIVKGGGETSNHINVTDIYSDPNWVNADVDGDGSVERIALKDNYLGAVAQGLISLSSTFGEPMASGGPVPLAASATPGPDLSDFWDGSFDLLGTFIQDLQAASLPTVDSALFDAWLELIGDGSPLTTMAWNATGAAAMVFPGGNPALELMQTADTSIGQLLLLDAADQTVEFDLDIVSAGAGDLLEVLFDGQTFAQLDLSSLPAGGHYTVSLAGRSSSSGMVTFRLAGPLETPAVVQLDNLAVSPFPFADDFNRPNSTSLGSNWIETEGNFSISNQKLTSTAVSTALVDAGASADVSLAATVNAKTTSKSKQAGLVARANGSDLYYAYISSTKTGVHKALIRKSVGGVWTTLLTKKVSKPSGVLVFDVVGSTLTLTYRGKLVGSVTDSSLATGCFGVRGLRGTVDSFSASAPADLAVTVESASVAARSADAGPALTAADVWRRDQHPLPATWQRRHGNCTRS